MPEAGPKKPPAKSVSSMTVGPYSYALLGGRWLGDRLIRGLALAYVNVHGTLGI
jgi:hypothetical protein